MLRENIERRRVAREQELVAGTPSTVSASGSLIVVNRKTSPFGAGWWLAGYERVYPQTDSTVLWVGGDGSARLYTAAGSGVYKAPGIDHPDSITVEGGNFVRHLRGGAKVEFAPNGKHFATSDRLGLVTFFHHDQYGQLAHIDPAGFAALRYDFAYSGDTGPLQTVTAPPVGGVARVVQRYVLGDGRILSHTDPDLTVVEFGFGNAAMPEQITSRRNRRNLTQSFAFDVAGKLVTVRVPLNASDTAVTTFCPAESRGFVTTGCSSGPLHPDSAVTVMDGPRTDVTDVTTFRLDRFGAPKLIRDALGNQTQLFRGNRDFPGLVTRIVHANGWVNDAFHDAKGLIVKLVQYAPLGPGVDAVTEYTWDPKWERVTSITYPEGDLVRFAYDPVTGNRIWQEDGRGATSRVNFTYHAATGLLATVQQPGASGVDSLVYDTRGNLSRTRTPLGFVSERFSDTVGRDTLTVTPIDATHTLRHRAVFDVVDQVTREETVGSSAITYTLAASGLTPDTAAVRNDTLVKTYAYDGEGNRTGVSSYATGGTTDVGTAESYTYDNANRLLTKDAGSGPRAFTYDPAGNATALTYATGKTVIQRFDALNRVTLRIVPERAFAKTRCQGFPTGPIAAPGATPGCQLVFPYYPNDGTGLTIPADISTFAYDAVGNVLTADNRSARVKRTYTPSGLVATDSLIFGSYATPSLDAERTGQVLGYDWNGRRTTMAWALGTTQYGYTSFGPLQQVIDPAGNTYRFVYDVQGRVDSLVVAASGGAVGVREQRTYDDDGRLARRERVSATLGRLALDSLFYDQRDKVTRARAYSRAQATEGAVLSYDPPGAVVAQERPRDVGGYQVEEFRNDAYGNAFYSRTRSSAAGNDAPFASSYAPDGAMLERHSVVPASPSSGQRDESVAQTAVGSDVERTGKLVSIPAVNGGGFAEQMAGRQYYSADSRLMVVQRYDYLVGSGDDVGTWEEYRYDALGRRILTRTRRDLTGPPAGSRFLCRDLTNNSCGSYVERTLWDGDQLLYEWRTAEAVPTGMTNGSAGYVHAEGLDQPVAALRTDGARVINYTWRGLGESSVFVSGAAGDCSLVVGTCSLPAVDWPGKTQGGVYFTPNALATGPRGADVVRGARRQRRGLGRAAVPAEPILRPGDGAVHPAGPDRARGRDEPVWVRQWRPGQSHRSVRAVPHPREQLSSGVLHQDGSGQRACRRGCDRCRLHRRNWRRLRPGSARRRRWFHELGNVCWCCRRWHRPECRCPRSGAR